MQAGTSKNIALPLSRCFYKAAGKKHPALSTSLFLLFAVIRLVILLLPGQGFGQTQIPAMIRPQIINYTNNQYQAESQNWSITQSEEDLLFFANNQGLLSYDGASWHRYPLPENQILRTVASDGKGRIYAGGFGVFGYYQKKNYGGYQFHNLSQLVRDSMFGAEEIWKIIPEDNFVLFQSFSRIHLLHGGQVKTLVAPGTILYTYPVRDQFYVQVLGKGLYRIDESEKLEPVSSKPQLRSGRITMMLPYGTRELLIGTEKDGLLRFDPISGQISAFPTDIDQELRLAEINNGVKLGDNLYAIGTIGQGVFFMDAQGQLIARVNKKAGLQNNTILGMYPDKEGNLWLAMDKGIAQLVLKSNVAYYKDLEGRIGTVYAVAIFQGKIYVGSNHGLYRAPFTQMDRFELSNLKEVPGITGQVWDLKILDSTLFCGNNTGTYRISQAGIAKISALPGGWDLEPLIRPENGQIERLLQGTYNGIAVYEKSGSAWQFSHLLKGTENMAVSRVKVAPDGKIWAMHAYKGIYLLTPDSSYRFLRHILQLPLQNMGPTTLGWCLFKAAGQIRLSGHGAIYKWDDARQKLLRDQLLEAYLAPYTNPRAIFTDDAAGVIPAASTKKTAYWVLDSDKQLHYKNPEGEWTHFALNSHLFNLVTGFEKILAIDPATSILTGEDGFVLLHKTKRILPVNLPGPSFRQINMLKEGKTVPLPTSYLQTNGSLRLPYHSNNLKISYSLAAYDQAATYSCRLLGSPEDNWSAYGNQGEKELNNLSAGRYQFQVKTNLSDKVSTLVIQVLNPWYFSIVARCTYLLLLLLLTLALWRLHQHRLKLQRQAMTLKMREALQLQREKNANQLLVMEQQKLKGEVLHKSEDLAKLAMELIKKKKALKRFKEELDQMKNQSGPVAGAAAPIGSRLQKLSKSLSKYIQDEESDWQLFDSGFGKVHEAFFEKLVQAYPDLTSQDLRLAAYLKMNLSTKEIAPLLNISVRGVEIKRYRLRKKLQLGPQDNLSDFMLRI